MRLPEQPRADAMRVPSFVRQECLAHRVAWPDDNSFEAIITDYPAPDCVVEIENQTAAALAEYCSDNPADVVRVKR